MLKEFSINDYKVAIFEELVGLEKNTSGAKIQETDVITGFQLSLDHLEKILTGDSVIARGIDDSIQETVVPYDLLELSNMISFVPVFQDSKPEDSAIVLIMNLKSLRVDVYRIETSDQSYSPQIFFFLNVK